MEEESRSCLQAIHSGTSEWKDAKKEEFISKWNQVMEKAESSYTSGEAAMKAISCFSTAVHFLPGHPFSYSLT